MEAANPLEQEIKLPVGDLAAVRASLGAAGATLLEPRAFEDNTVFDDPANSLATTGRLLRLRRYAETWVLTFKGRATFLGPVKTREEIETRVDDGAAARALLTALGFTPRWRYQKWRELWSLDGVHVALDEAPLGRFVELEGDPGRLAPAARRLGLEVTTAVTGSYRDLWFAHRATHPDAGWDMVFEAGSSQS